MDREKQRRLERERMEKERAEMADDDKGHEADEDGDGPRLPRKSKFVRNLTSDSFLFSLVCNCLYFLD